MQQCYSHETAKRERYLEVIASEAYVDEVAVFGDVVMFARPVIYERRSRRQIAGDGGESLGRGDGCWRIYHSRIIQCEPAGVCGCVLCVMKLTCLVNRTNWHVGGRCCAARQRKRWVWCSPSA